MDGLDARLGKTFGPDEFQQDLDKSLDSAIGTVKSAGTVTFNIAKQYETDVETLLVRNAEVVVPQMPKNSFAVQQYLNSLIAQVTEVVKSIDDVEKTFNSIKEYVIIGLLVCSITFLVLVAAASVASVMNWATLLAILN